MKHRYLFNTLLCAVALQCTASASHAASITTLPQATSPYLLESSSASLVLSGDLLFGFSLGGIRVMGVDGASYAAGRVGTVLNQVATDDATGAFTSYLAQGGAQLRIASAGPGGGPGLVVLSNLSVDPGALMVYGDVTGPAGSTPQHIALFSMASVAGDLVFNGAGDYSVTASRLRATPLGIQLISDALAINGLAGSALRDLENWGTLQANFKVSAVPESSSVILLAMGLGAVAFAARRNRQVRQAH